MRTITALLVLVFGVVVPAAAYGLDVSAEAYHSVYISEKLEAGQGVKLRASGEMLYIWGSYEQTMTRFGGQEATDIDLLGAGIGMRRALDGINLWMEAGYFMPSITYRTSWPEAAAYEMNSVVTGATKHWEVYEYALKPAVGGAIGISYLYKMGLWAVSLDSAYRYLRLGEWIIGHNSDWPGPGGNPRWEIYQDRDFSAWQIGIALKRRF